MAANPLKLASSFEDCQKKFYTLSQSISATLVTMYRSKTPSPDDREEIMAGSENLEKSLKQLVDNLKEL